MKKTIAVHNHDFQNDYGIGQLNQTRPIYRRKDFQSQSHLGWDTDLTTHEFNELA